MEIFYKKLQSYINKYQNSQETAPHFEYDKTTCMSPEVAFEIHSLIKQRNSLHSMWEKESDYNRLLRMENSELRYELESACIDDFEDEEEPFTINKDQQDLLS